jgi:hypothetical protein
MVTLFITLSVRMEPADTITKSNVSQKRGVESLYLTLVFCVSLGLQGACACARVRVHVRVCVCVCVCCLCGGESTVVGPRVRACVRECMRTLGERLVASPSLMHACARRQRHRQGNATHRVLSQSTRIIST